MLAEARGLFALLSAACVWWVGDYIAGARWACTISMLIIDLDSGWQTLGAAE